MYLLTLLSAVLMPSLSSSPWIRGAPQRGFSRHILRIRSRTSHEMRGRPGRPRRTFRVQKRRNAARCQATTVSGLTMASVERQSHQRRERQIQNRRSPEVNFGSFAADLCSTPIWWRRARFSSSSAARERRIEATTARNVLKRRSINKNYARKDKPHPFRGFEIFGRHRSNRQEVGLEFDVPVLSCPKREGNAGKFIDNGNSQSVSGKIYGLYIAFACIAGIDPHMLEIFRSEDRERVIAIFPTTRTYSPRKAPLVSAQGTNKTPPSAELLLAQDPNHGLRIANRTHSGFGMERMVR